MSFDLNKGREPILQKSGGSEFQSWGGRTAESSVPHSGELGRGNNKVSGGQRPKGMKRNSNVD